MLRHLTTIATHRCLLARLAPAGLGHYPRPVVRAFAADAAVAEKQSDSAPATTSAPKLLTFGVQGQGTKTLTTVTNYSKAHHLKLDEPTSLGGTDAAANPVEYLLAGLTGCIQVTLHVIASEENVTLDKVEWDANGDLDLRGFLGVPGVFPGFQRIDVTARISTPADLQKLEALRQKVLTRCPVGNTIVAPGVKYTLKFVKA